MGRLVRAGVLRELERLRVAGAIGAPLDAVVELYATPEVRKALTPLGDELRFVLICSKATLLRAAEEKLVVSALPHGKCERCWHVREDVGANTEHPELCGRCINNLFGEGETRAFA